MDNLKRSLKKVKPLSDIMTDRIFILPKSMANAVSDVRKKPCILVQVNGEKYYIPVEEPTPIPYAAFCALRDIGVENFYETYEKGEAA